MIIEIHFGGIISDSYPASPYHAPFERYLSLCILFVSGSCLDHPSGRFGTSPPSSYLQCARTLYYNFHLFMSNHISLCSIRIFVPSPESSKVWQPEIRERATVAQQQTEVNTTLVNVAAPGQQSQNITSTAQTGTAADPQPGVLTNSPDYI